MRSIIHLTCGVILMLKDRSILCLVLIIFLFSFYFLSPVFFNNNFVLEAAEETEIDMSFRGADLRDVFSTLADLAGVNLIMHQGVEGRISLQLEGITFRNALKMLTTMNDYDYYSFENTYIIARPELLRDVFEDQQVMISSLEHMAPEKSARIISSIYPELQVEVDDEGNKLILSGIVEDLNRAQCLINELDFRLPGEKHEELPFVLKGVVGDYLERVAFIENDDEVFVVRQGEVFNGLMVKEIGKNEVELIHLDTGIIYGLRLGGGYGEAK